MLALPYAPGPGSDARWLVRMRDIRFRYPNGVTALGGVDLDIDAGEVVALIGPSGCGKSTVVSVLAGLREATGTVEWNPDALTDVDDRHRRRLNVVFQKNTVLPWLSVEKNIGFGLRYLKLSKAEARQRVDSLLDLGGLADFRKAYPRELSGGMLRRVALLTGMATYPKLLVLDEPFSALDEPTRIQIHGDLLRLVRELDMAVLLITHDLGEAVSLCDRVGVMTRRPAVIADLERVDLGPKPRDVEKVRATEAYLQSYQRLWTSLWKQIGEDR